MALTYTVSELPCLLRGRFVSRRTGVINI